MKRAFLASAFVHLALLLAFIFSDLQFGGGNGNGQGDGTEQGQGNSRTDEERNIVDKPLQIVEVPPEVQKNGSFKKEPKKVPPKDNCPKYFGGIGITFSPMTGAVETSHPGYPAYEAGIRDRDIILEASEEIVGPVGTPVTLIILRDSERYKVTIIRGKICIE